MASDSVCASAYAPSLPKDFGKKKRANRSAKLKQFKLDARREQWLSQVGVKNKQGKEELAGREALPCNKGGKQLIESLEGSARGERNKEHVGVGVGVDVDIEVNELIDAGFGLDSPSCSPNSILVLGGVDSAANFTSSSSSSGSSAGCCSGNITEEERDEREVRDGSCFDDWEVMADALAAADTGTHDKPCLDSVYSTNCESTGSVDSNLSNSLSAHPRLTQNTSSRPKTASGNSRAWRADDAYRPRSLPNLAKQWSFPNTGRHYSQGMFPWACTSSPNVPSSCPICYEDLDLTDTSFLPCCCGFRLCLFCHKRILEDDGRCPGCRKPYECDPVEAETIVDGSSLTLKLTRCSSVITRS